MDNTAVELLRSEMDVAFREVSVRISVPTTALISMCTEGNMVPVYFPTAGAGSSRR